MKWVPAKEIVIIPEKVTIDVRTCDHCEQDKPCLIGDPDDERINFCFDCIQEAFARFEVKS